MNTSVRIVLASDDIVRAVRLSSGNIQLLAASAHPDPYKGAAVSLTLDVKAATALWHSLAIELGLRPGDGRKVSLPLNEVVS